MHLNPPPPPPTPKNEKEYTLAKTSHTFSHRDLNGVDGHTCSESNPCLHYENQKDHGFYFTHMDSDDMYVQCSEHGDCFERHCSPGTFWDQHYYACCNEDLGCSVVEDEDILPLLENRLHTGCGTQTTYYPTVQMWPPEHNPNAPHWCNSNDECDSCCCGKWFDYWTVCIPYHDGMALGNVCPEH